MKNELQMVVTDLDGTLLNPERKISSKDTNTLRMLGRKNVVRVIATGRSLFSVNKVLLPNCPIDYLIFSSGAGIQDWETKEIIQQHSMQSTDILKITEYLMNHNIDFMIHDTIPNSHHFYFFTSGKENPDFERRLDIYKPYASPYDINEVNVKSASQFVAILPDSKPEYTTIRTDLNKFRVIRTTSPLDHKTLWVEIFPRQVSKGHAAAWLCNQLNIDQSQVLSIGNDYNDLDLLEWSKHSFVVENAPDDLKRKFRITKANHKSAFTASVETLID